MLIDQDEINSLLAEAEELTDDGAVAASPAEPDAAAKALQAKLEASPELARLMKIRVPVIVRLAERKMRVDAIRRFSTGAIIEFTTHVDDKIDLMVNNRVIGEGTAVKVGENFGLKISGIRSRKQRIRSLGG